MDGGKFYVDFCASFGSLYGNDAYSRFAYVHKICLARAAKCPLLQHYIDNYFEPTLFKVSAKETMREALAKATCLRKELDESGMFYHEFQGPTTRTKLLGWMIDTLKTTVEMPEERRTVIFSKCVGIQGQMQSARAQFAYRHSYFPLNAVGRSQSLYRYTHGEEE